METKDPITPPRRVGATHAGPHDPAISGQWELIQYRCKHLPVHAVLLHTGKVLTFGGSCNDPKLFGQPRQAELWDPETGAIQWVEQDLAGDIFCAGHAFLPDGRLLVAGGTAGYDYKRHLFGQDIPLRPFQGMSQSYIFDPLTERWTRADNMAVGRWYPTLCMLGDGRIVCMAGLTQHFPWVVLRKIEVYVPGAGWQVMKGADRWLPLYPRLHLLPDGRVFYSGSYNTHYTFPFNLTQFPTSILDPRTGKWDDLGLPNKSEREEGTTFMLPLRPPDYRATVVLAGGGTPTGADALSDCEMIDLSQPQPRWQPVDPMQHARYYVYPVILPDGKTLALGGRSGTKGHDMPMPPGDGNTHPGAEKGPTMGRAMAALDEIAHDPRAVLEPEMFDPQTLHWTPMAPMTVDRLYHASALLLLDGRVAVFGSNPMQGTEELRIEIYHPPYLFHGSRPRVRNAPRVAAYGEQITIDSPDAGEVEGVVLIRPTATTHCLNPEQRLIELEFNHDGHEALTARAPANPNVCPPGYYMLFLLIGGVPSVGRMVLVQG